MSFFQQRLQRLITMNSCNLEGQQEAMDYWFVCGLVELVLIDDWCYQFPRWLRPTGGEGLSADGAGHLADASENHRHRRSSLLLQEPQLQVSPSQAGWGEGRGEWRGGAGKGVGPIYWPVLATKTNKLGEAIYRCHLKATSGAPDR